MKFSKAILLGSVFTLPFITVSTSKVKVAQADDGFAIVELFTSEGCSSCPAAEAVLAEINNTHQKNVYVMEFHVDYWNYLGWKDVYSSKEYTNRQQDYARAFHLNSSYTPQAVVNGSAQIAGSESFKLRSLISDFLKLPSQGKINIAVTASGAVATIKYTTAATTSQTLNIALVQKNVTTDVRKGENTGRKLSHVNVVRSFKTVVMGHGSVIFTLPDGCSPGDFSIIAFSQEGNGGLISTCTQSLVN